jgi:hypothetical protein
MCFKKGWRYEEYKKFEAAGTLHDQVTHFCWWSLPSIFDQFQKQAFVCILQTYFRQIEAKLHHYFVYWVLCPELVMKLLQDAYPSYSYKDLESFAYFFI